MIALERYCDGLLVVDREALSPQMAAWLLNYPWPVEQKTLRHWGIPRFDSPALFLEDGVAQLSAPLTEEGLRLFSLSLVCPVCSTRYTYPGVPLTMNSIEDLLPAMVGGVSGALFLRCAISEPMNLDALLVEESS